MHVSGPWPCGENPDMKIFRAVLKHILLPGEKVIADKGYKGESGYIWLPSEGNDTQKRACQLIRA